MTAIFISYRRKDARPYAERLWDQLKFRFGDDNIFFDQSGIESGTEFPEVIGRAIKSAEVLLVVIGPEWLSESNQRRLFEEEDFVRQEIALGLARLAESENILVIPVLVGDAKMPQEANLPVVLRPLSKRQAHRLNGLGDAYSDQVDTLVALIDQHCGGLLARRLNVWVADSLRDPALSWHRYGQNLAVAAQTSGLIPRRRALAVLDDWWTNWSGVRQPFVLLGEEGDGKSWAMASWLAKQLDGSRFQTPIVYIAANRLGSADIETILASGLEQATPSQPPDGWRKRLHFFSQREAAKAPLFLLVIDALNERPSEDWRRLFDAVLAEPWRGRVALVALCRNAYWQGLAAEFNDRVTAWTLPPFDADELDQALAVRGERREHFSDQVLALMAKPRLLDLALRMQGKVEDGGVTLERLVYEDWRDMMRRKRNLPAPLEHEDFQSLIAGLVKQYGQRIPEAAFPSTVGSRGDPQAIRTELLSARILERKNGKLETSPRALILGFGLLLAYAVEESGETNAQALQECIAQQRGAAPLDLDLQVSICGMALCHAMAMQGYPEAGRLALLRAWIEGRNLDPEGLADIAAYLPLRPESYLSLVEYLWGEADNREAQDAFMIGFLHHRWAPNVQAAMVRSFTRWLGFVHGEGYRGGFGSDAEEKAKARTEVEARLGRPAEPGPLNLFGYSLEVIVDRRLLRLARVALAVISHPGDRMPYLAALVGGVIAKTVMGEHQEELAWVFHTASGTVHAGLLAAARRLLDEQSSLATLVARNLLGVLGNETARELRQNIPVATPSNPLPRWTEAQRCALFMWDEGSYRQCLALSGFPPNRIAERLQAIALDPDLTLPQETATRLLEAGADLDLAKIACGTWTSSEDHTLEEIEPALCAFSVDRYTALVRALAAGLAEREGESLHMLAWRVNEHLPALDDTCRAIVEAAWQGALTHNDKQDRWAEHVLFGVVLFDRPSLEQLEIVTHRFDENGYFSIPRFRPLLPEHHASVAAALEYAVDCEGPKPRYRLLWYLAGALRTLDGALRAKLLALFHAGDSVVRALCLEIFAKTDDLEAAQHVIQQGWRVQAGRERELENQRGSILLARYGQALDFTDLADRIDPEWLGYAFCKRNQPEQDLAAYAALLDGVWHTIAAQAGTPDEYLLRHVVLKVDRDDAENLARLGAEEPDTGPIFMSGVPWGGQRGSGTVEDMQKAFNSDAIASEQQALYERVITLVEAQRDQGNPWFSHSFHHGHLHEVVCLNEARWRSWIDPVLIGGRDGRRLLALCRGFYETLCVALLSTAPEAGLQLYRALAANPTVTLRDARTGLPALLLGIFCVKDAPQVNSIRLEVLESSHSDLALLEVSLLAHAGGHLDWLSTTAHHWLECSRDSHPEYDRARAIALLGFSSDQQQDVDFLTHWQATHPDSWVRDVAQIALQNHRRNTWARRWFDRFLEREDKAQAWAAFRLFLRCTDRRVWFWLPETLLTEAALWKQDALAANMNVIEKAIERNEKGWRDQFLGQKVKPRELWPWMGDYI